jgi:hypothetical protein
MEASQRAAVHALLVEIPIGAAVASSPDPSMGEGGLNANLDTAVGHRYHGPPPHLPKQACNKSYCYKLAILNLIQQLIFSLAFHVGYLRP